MTSDLITVERKYEGERCGCGRNSGFPTERGQGCPFLITFDEEIDYANGTITTKWHCMAFKKSLGCSGPYRCSSCLATPAVRVLTPKMVEAVKRARNVLERFGSSAQTLSASAKLRAAFMMVE